MKTFQTNKSKPREYYVELGVYKIPFPVERSQRPKRRWSEGKMEGEGEGKEKVDVKRIRKKREGKRHGKEKSKGKGEKYFAEKRE